MGTDVVGEAVAGGKQNGGHGRHRRENADASGASFLMVSTILSADRFKSLVPAGPPPLAFTALADAYQRVLDAMRSVLIVNTADALVAAARVVFGKAGHRREVARRFLAQDHAVLGIYVVRAGARAVDEMGAACLLVPGPLITVEIPSPAYSCCTIAPCVCANARNEYAPPA